MKKIFLITITLTLGLSSGLKADELFQKISNNQSAIKKALDHIHDIALAEVAKIEASNKEKTQYNQNVDILKAIAADIEWRADSKKPLEAQLKETTEHQKAAVEKLIQLKDLELVAPFMPDLDDLKDHSHSAIRDAAVTLRLLVRNAKLRKEAVFPDSKKADKKTLVSTDPLNKAAADSVALKTVCDSTAGDALKIKQQLDTLLRENQNRLINLEKEGEKRQLDLQTISLQGWNKENFEKAKEELQQRLYEAFELEVKERGKWKPAENTPWGPHASLLQYQFFTALSEKDFRGMRKDLSEVVATPLGDGLKAFSELNTPEKRKQFALSEDSSKDKAPVSAEANEKLRKIFNHLNHGADFVFGWDRKPGAAGIHRIEQPEVRFKSIRFSKLKEIDAPLKAMLDELDKYSRAEKARTELERVEEQISATKTTITNLLEAFREVTQCSQSLEAALMRSKANVAADASASGIATQLRQVHGDLSQAANHGDEAKVRVEAATPKP